jgi:hypothetical protein
LPREDRPIIRDVATRLLNRLQSDRWSVYNTTFLLRPDQQLAILQAGRQINPEAFSEAYDNARRRAIGIGLPISPKAPGPSRSRASASPPPRRTSRLLPNLRV